MVTTTTTETTLITSGKNAETELKLNVCQVPEERSERTDPAPTIYDRALYYSLVEISTLMKMICPHSNSVENCDSMRRGVPGHR